MEELKPDGLRPRESIKRSAIKSLVYRVLMVLSDFGILYLFSGKLPMAIGFAVVNNFWNMIAYFLYDRVWNNINWGRTIHKYDPKEKKHFWW